jgi:hypothetical protein
MRYFNNLCVTILLSMLAISAPLLSVGVMRRTAIQELTKAINAHTISPVEARKKALSFKLTGSDLNDAVVKELIVTADNNGIQDILNPVKPEDLSDRSLVAKSEALAKEEAPKERRQAPATTSEVELRQEKKETEARAHVAEMKAIPSTKLTARVNTDKLPENIRNLINSYVNKKYSVEEIKELRKKNQMAQTTNQKGIEGRIEAWLDPYAQRNTKEELNEYVKNFVMPIATNARVWDKQSLIDQYYYISLAKPYFKKFDDINGLNSLSNLLVTLLGQNSNETTLVIDAITDKTPIKNKYFVEIIDEWTAAQIPIAPIVTKQDFPTQKIDKDFEKEERNYFREPHEDETPVEKEESMSGASSRIKD